MEQKVEAVLKVGEESIVENLWSCKQRGQWRIRTNAELQELFKQADITTEIKQRLIHWLGRIERMEESRVPKKVFCHFPGGVKRARLQGRGD